MFDSLREKLGTFREDVEETAEEKAEPIEDEELDDEPLDDEVADDERDEDAAADSLDDEVADETLDEDADGDVLGDESTDDAFEAEPTDDAFEAEPTDDAFDDEALDVDATGDELDDAAENNGVSFGQKARSLVRGRVVIEEDDLEGPLWDLEMALLQSDVEVSVAEAILDRIREELIGETRTFVERTSGIVTDALREALLDVVSVGQFDFDERVTAAEKPFVIVFTGVNGVGKTTSIAKLSRYLEERGLSTVLANGDTYRAGANEQISVHADRLEKPLISHDQGGDPTAVLYDAVEYAQAHDIDVVLCDTAGRLHTSRGLMDQLEKIGRVVDPDMTLFVDEAVAGQDAVTRAREFDAAIEIDGAILTKADADANGGAAISIAHVTGKPICFLGTGQEYDDLERFDPEAMVDRLLGEE